MYESKKDGVLVNNIQQIIDNSEINFDAVDFVLDPPESQWTKGLIGAVGTGGGLYATRQALNTVPGGGAKLLADNMHNFLEGFYDKGATKLTRRSLAAKEVVRGAGRIAKQFANPLDSMVYKQTGIAPYIVEMFKDNQNRMNKLEQMYIDGHIDFNTAKNGIRNLEKQIHFKLTSDYSNAHMYGEAPKSPLKNYASKYVSVGSKSNFIKSAGGKDVAAYVISRQPGVGYVDDFNNIIVDYDGLKLMKYKNVNFSDVVRGAQFDKDFYKGMRTLKGKKSLESAHTAIKKVLPNSTAMITGDRVVFNISPSIRPNYDWGGFNAVGIWDPNSPTKIKIMATDKRSLFGLKLGGANTINYVESKDIEIADLKKEFKEPVHEEPKPKSDKKYKSRTEYERRVENAKTLRLNKGKTGQDAYEQVIKPFEQKKQKVINIIRNPNIRNQQGWNQLMKFAKPLARRAGVVGGAASMLMLAKEMFGDND